MWVNVNVVSGAREDLTEMKVFELNAEGCEGMIDPRDSLSHRHRKQHIYRPKMGICWWVTYPCSNST